MEIVGDCANKQNKKIRVTFVCTGNTCRSPMAEYIFKDYLNKNSKSSLFIVKSAGLSADPQQTLSQNARIVLKQMGIKTTNRKAQVLTLDLVKKSDLIICMTASHANALKQFSNVVTVASLTGGLDVSDPYGQDVSAYKSVAEYLEYMCKEIITKCKLLKN